MLALPDVPEVVQGVPHLFEHALDGDLLFEFVRPAAFGCSLSDLSDFFFLLFAYATYGFEYFRSSNRGLIPILLIQPRKKRMGIHPHHLLNLPYHLHLIPLDLHPIFLQLPAQSSQLGLQPCLLLERRRQRLGLLLQPALIGVFDFRPELVLFPASQVQLEVVAGELRVLGF